MALTINGGKKQVPAGSRGALGPNAIFRYVDSKSGETYANFGFGNSARKYFSVALTGKKAGLLCGSPNATKKVSIIGTFTIEALMLPRYSVKKMCRRDLKAGDVFQVPASAEARAGHKPALYVHLGTVNDGRGVLSYNLNTKKLAVGTKLRGAVVKVGDTRIDTKIAA